MPLSAPNSLVYICQFHAAMRGTLNIINPPLPPSVAVTNPPTGITLAAPATLTLRARATDADGNVALVRFFSGKSIRPAR